VYLEPIFLNPKEVDSNEDGKYLNLKYKYKRRHSLDKGRIVHKTERERPLAGSIQL
jgi:hypothetical protein